MKDLSNNELLKNIDSKYSLVTVISKRARQILEGSTPLVERESEEEGAISIAIREYKENLLDFRKIDRAELEAEENLSEEELAENVEKAMSEKEVLEEEQSPEELSAEIIDTETEE